MKRIFTGVLCIFVLSTSHAWAQGFKSAVQERAQTIKEFRTMLQSEDPAIRMAAFEEAMKQDDDTLQTMAREAALSGDDERLQTAALKALIGQRSTLTVEISLPDNPTDDEERRYARQKNLSLSHLELSDNASEFECGGVCQGMFKRGGFIVQFNHCRLDVQVANGTTLVGTYNCKNTRPFPAMIHLD